MVADHSPPALKTAVVGGPLSLHTCVWYIPPSVDQFLLPTGTRRPGVGLLPPWSRSMQPTAGPTQQAILPGLSSAPPQVPTPSEKPPEAHPEAFLWQKLQLKAHMTFLLEPGGLTRRRKLFLPLGRSVDTTYRLRSGLETRSHGGGVTSSASFLTPPLEGPDLTIPLCPVGATAAPPCDPRPTYRD